MTIDQCADEVLKALGEDPTAPVYWTRAEVRENVAVGVRLFCTLTLVYRRVQTVNVSAVQYTHLRALLPDFLHPFRLSVGGVRLRSVTMRQIAAQDDRWPSAPGAPERYRVGGDVLTLFPPAAAAVTVDYVAEPATGPSATIPVQDDDLKAIENWAVFQSRWKEGGQELAKDKGRFQAFLEQARRRADQVRRVCQGENLDMWPPDDKLFEFTLKMPAIPKPPRGDFNA